jgi:hypothetical protein
MSFKVRIHLQRSGDTVAKPVGVKELQARPSIGDEVSFEHNGVVETGHVKHIEPPDHGTEMAKIVVVQSPGN